MNKTKKHAVTRKQLIFELDGKTYSLQLKVGNNKPIDSDTGIISMSSAVNCCNTACPFHISRSADCYGLKYELNKRFMKATLLRRLKDQITIDKLVYTPGGAELLAAEILKHNKNSKKYKINFQRWNETGEIRNLDYLIFVNDTAEILYKKAGIVSTIYTHQEKIYNQFKELNIQSKGLIILGSGFMADICFDAGEPDGSSLDCSGNCIQCKHDNGGHAAYCYDLKLKGKNVTIKEPLRKNTSSNKETSIPDDIKELLNQVVLKYTS